MTTEAMSQGQIDEKMVKRQQAIISSMTREERKNADLLNASRKKRIAAGSGTEVSEINRLIKQYLQMRDMMKQMKKMGQKGFMRQLESNPQNFLRHCLPQFQALSFGPGSAV